MARLLLMALLLARWLAQWLWFGCVTLGLFCRDLGAAFLVVRADRRARELRHILRS